ncbi:MAG: DegT/DnrJ/EryC1/StrS family aminotransferase [Burkholderiales bacterium]
MKSEIDHALLAVLESTQYVLGPNVEALEIEVACYCGVGHAVALASGTDALHLALRACGIGTGHEVITTPFTFIATAEAISYTGARPVFVDIDARTFNLDPALIEAAITPRTRAVLPVHLFGLPAHLEPIAALCHKHGLKMIEDCAQSFGADYGGRKSGAYGDLGCFSFYPSKNLAAFGDAGMIVTDQTGLADALRVYRNHGSREQYHHSMVGYNSRLDELQAAVLRIKLKHIERFNAARRSNAALYNKLLRDSPLVTPSEDPDSRHVYHQYTLLSERRDAIRSALSQAGIASAIYYPVPLHLQHAYRDLCAGQRLPACERIASQVVSLPMYPELTVQQIERICEVVTAAA